MTAGKQENDHHFYSRYRKYLHLDQRLLEADAKGFKLLLLAFLTGLIAGGLGTFFRWLLSLIEDFRSRFLADISQKTVWEWLLIAALMTLAIALAIWLVRWLAPEAGGSGIQEVEGALDELRPMRWKRVIPVKFLASLLSLGSGLLLGREGPTVQLGANAGKMVKDISRQSVDHDNPLISTGAAAGLASAFNAPLSGILFVIEEMNEHFRFNFFSVASIMIGAGTADCLVRIFLGDSPAISMQIMGFKNLHYIWLFGLLGILLGLIGYVFNKSLLAVLDFFKRLKVPFILVAALLALLIGVLGYFSSDLTGSGYNTIYLVLGHSFEFRFLLVLLLIRFLFTIISYGSGAPGGIFTPLLTIGVIGGMIFGTVVKSLFPGFMDEPAIFAVAGMAGVFAATVRAPITGVVLAIEMTSNFGLILPLIVTALFASFITTMLGNQPIYAVLLKRILNKEENHT